MSRGKYSPSLQFLKDRDRECEYNAYDEFGEIIHYGGHDSDGYDYYGYSSFDYNGNYVGKGHGVDRWGYTEMDYLTMCDCEYERILKAKAYFS